MSGPPEEEEVITVSVFYLNTAGGKPDINYYLNQLLPMVQRSLAPQATHGS